MKYVSFDYFFLMVLSSIFNGKFLISHQTQKTNDFESIVAYRLDTYGNLIEIFRTITAPHSLFIPVKDAFYVYDANQFKCYNISGVLLWSKSYNALSVLQMRNHKDSVYVVGYEFIHIFNSSGLMVEHEFNNRYHIFENELYQHIGAGKYAVYNFDKQNLRILNVPPDFFIHSKRGNYYCNHDIYNNLNIYSDGNLVTKQCNRGSYFIGKDLVILNLDYMESEIFGKFKITKYLIKYPVGVIRYSNCYRIISIDINDYEDVEIFPKTLKNYRHFPKETKKLIVFLKLVLNRVFLKEIASLITVFAI